MNVRADSISAGGPGSAPGLEGDSPLVSGAGSSGAALRAQQDQQLCTQCANTLKKSTNPCSSLVVSPQLAVRLQLFAFRKMLHNPFFENKEMNTGLRSSEDECLILLEGKKKNNSLLPSNPYCRQLAQAHSCNLARKGSKPPRTGGSQYPAAPGGGDQDARAGGRGGGGDRVAGPGRGGHEPRGLRLPQLPQHRLRPLQGGPGVRVRPAPRLRGPRQASVQRLLFLGPKGRGVQTQPPTGGSRGGGFRSAWVFAGRQVLHIVHLFWRVPDSSLPSLPPEAVT